MEQEKSDTPDIPLRDAVLMDRLTAPLAFAELTQTVESMMLSEPLERTSVEQYTGERAVIAKLGSHALRVLLEHQDGAEYNLPDDLLEPFDIVRWPETFVDQELPGVAEWAQDFGDALLKEAYKCLGAEVEQKIAEYRAATTVEDQVVVIQWLDERLHAMRERQIPDNDFMIYHPLRLSPKVIGRYPNIMLPPTCLGFSIIATSFLHSAGAPTLHAGVMRTSYQDDIIVSCDLSVRTARDITAMSDGRESSITEALYNRGVGSYGDMLDADSGYHAVALARLMDGQWAQVDPNFRMTQVIDIEDHNEALTRAYEQLEEFAPVAPMLELTVATSTNSLVKEWAKAYAPKLRVSPQRARDLVKALTDDGVESIPRRIYEVIYAMHKESHAEDDPEHPATKTRQEFGDSLFFTDDNDEFDPLSDATPLGDQVYTLISKYVLYEQDIAEFKARCRRDRRFLQRRVSDALSIVVSLQAIETGLLVGSARTDVPHAAYEVGRPAQRVAMTVLSDFAALMTNDPLPPTFWHSVWPSLVPATETAAAARTSEQWAAAEQMIDFVQSKTLQYHKNYSKIINANEIPETKE